jgi:hypothetical protein
MSARKRLKQKGTDDDAPPVPPAQSPPGSAKDPLQLPVGTHVAFSRRTIDTSDGAPAMACFHGIVVNDGGDRVDTPSVEQLQLRFALTDGGDDVVWWEDTCNMYEIIAPSSFASQHTCQGIRRAHFKPDAAAAFRRKVETAKGERAWLDVDADRVLDERAVTLSPRVQGILSYSVVPQSGEFASLSLRHYLLLSPVDLRACNAGFHDMRCTSDTTTVERPLFYGASVGIPPPVRCDYCQWLFEGVVRPQVLVMQRKIRQKEAAAAAAGGGGASLDTIGRMRNDLLTRPQVQEKLERAATDKLKLQKRVSYLTRRNYELMADEARARAGVSSVVHGSVEVDAAEYTAVLTAACDSKEVMRTYYNRALKTPEQADAAIAIMESELRNMQSFNATGSKGGFRYSPLCFASAITMFATMPTRAYVALSFVPRCVQ